MKASHVLLAGLMITSVVHGQPSTNSFGSSSTAVLTVNIPPVALNLNLTLAEDNSRTFSLPASDANQDPLTFVIVTPPQHGVLGPVANSPLPGTITYTPALNYHGPDSFIYKANDGLADSGPATVSLNVLPVNDAPVAQSQAVFLDEDIPTSIVLGAFDVESDPLTYNIGAPAHGTLTGVAPNLVYQPATNYFGSDEFTFTVSDGRTNSSVGTVNITVWPVNDAPVASIVVTPLFTNVPGLTNWTALTAVCGDAPVVLDCSAASDAENDTLSFVWFDGTNAIATGPRATGFLKAGHHEISVHVSDGRAVGKSAATLAAITPAQAVGIAVRLAKESGLHRRNHQPLVVSLENATAAFDRCNAKVGTNQLETFKTKLTVQSAELDPELSANLTTVVDQVLAITSFSHTSADRTISVVVPGDLGYSYTVQSKLSLVDAGWRNLTTIIGTGSPVVTVWPCVYGQEYFRWVRTLLESAGDLWFGLPQSASFDVVESIAESPDGNIVVAANEGGVNLSLMKYSPSGSMLWQKVFFGTIAPRAVTVARDGAIYVTGFYLSNQNLGGSNLSGSLSQRFIFLAKYAADGSHIWSRGFGSSSGHSSGNGVAVDSAGNVHVAGYFAGADFGDGFVFGNTGGSAFVASYSATGGFRWKRAFGSSLASCNSMGTDASGNLYLAGIFFQTLDLGGALLAAQDYAGWMAKLSQAGNLSWSRQFGAFKNNDYRYGANGLAVNGNSVCIAGTYVGAINLGGQTYTSNPLSFFDVFFARFSTTGAHEWSTVLTSTAPSTGWGLAAAADDGGMLFTGRFYGTALFGNGQVATQVANVNSYVAKYSSTGQCLWVRSLPGNNEGHCVLLSGAAFAGGWFTGTTTFNNETHSSVLSIQGTPSQDAYLIRIQ